jgi:signal transduction histidine kinase
MTPQALALTGSEPQSVAGPTAPADRPSGPGGVSLMLWLGSVAALVVVATALLLGLALREREQQSWRQQVSNLSLTLAEHASQTLFSAHTVLSSLNDVVKSAHLETDAQWQAYAGAAARHQLLVDKVSSNPIIDVATFTSRSGQVLNFTRSYPAPPINLSERDYFKAHVADPTLEVFTSVPVRNKGNGKWVFYLTRRVNNSQGEMLGLILVGVSVEVFSKFYQQVATHLGEGASVSLYRSDLTLMTRFPLKDDWVGKRMVGGATDAFLQTGARGSGVLQTRTPDQAQTGPGPTALAAPTVLERYPLVVMPVVDEAFYLRNWRQVRNGIFMVAALCLVLLAGGMAVLLRSARMVNAELEERVRAQASLRAMHGELELRVLQRTAELSQEVQERRQAQEALAQLNARIASVSHRAGMAEVANSVLHNVGNVLNSVNVSVSLLDERLRSTPLQDLPAAAELIRAHQGRLGEFLTQDKQGQQFPPFLSLLAEHWQREHEMLQSEAKNMRAHVQVIQEIISRQQALSGQAGLREFVDVAQMMGDVLAIHALPLRRSEIEVEKKWNGLRPWMGDRIRVSQVLLNLVVNAQESLEVSDCRPRRLHLQAELQADGGLEITVSDNGLGIAAQHMPRLFTYGFTTKADGHGFGLHASALAAQEMGGSLEAFSAGTGQGAAFVLRLPELKT